MVEYLSARLFSPSEELTTWREFKDKVYHSEKRLLFSPFATDYPSVPWPGISRIRTQVRKEVIFVGKSTGICYTCRAKILC